MRALTPPPFDFYCSARACRRLGHNPAYGTPGRAFWKGAAFWKAGAFQKARLPERAPFWNAGAFWNAGRSGRRAFQKTGAFQKARSSGRPARCRRRAFQKAGAFWNAERSGRRVFRGTRAPPTRSNGRALQVATAAYIPLPVSAVSACIYSDLCWTSTAMIVSNKCLCDHTKMRNVLADRTHRRSIADRSMIAHLSSVYCSPHRLTHRLILLHRHSRRERARSIGKSSA